MIDNIKNIADVSNVPKYIDNDGNFIIGKLTLFPIIDPKTGDVVKYQLILQNILFTYYHREEILTFSNSLQKLQKGNNYSDFSFLELQEAIKKIEKLTGINAKYFEVKKLEFALNIETDEKPHQYLPMFSDYRGKEFDKMKSNAFWYGNKYILTEYALKIYDKSEMIKRSEGISLDLNILRFETAYSRARKVPSIQTLADLKDKRKIKLLFIELINQVEKLNCIGNEDFSNVPSRDREMYFAGQNSRFWIAEKQLNKNTAKDKKKRYRDIQQKVAKKNLIDEFTEKLKQKFDQLIQS